MLAGASQVPASGLEISFRIEQFLHPEIVGFGFARPLVRGVLRYLHQPSFTSAAEFLWIEPAFSPDHRFYQHWIKMVFGSDSGNKTVVLLEPGGTHPFEHCVNWIARPERQVNETRSYGQQYNENELEGESNHF